MVDKKKDAELEKKIVQASQELEDDFYLTQVVGIPLKPWQIY